MNVLSKVKSLLPVLRGDHANHRVVGGLVASVGSAMSMFACAGAAILGVVEPPLYAIAAIGALVALVGCVAAGVLGEKADELSNQVSTAAGKQVEHEVSSEDTAQTIYGGLPVAIPLAVIAAAAYIAGV